MSKTTTITPRSEVDARMFTAIEAVKKSKRVRWKKQIYAAMGIHLSNMNHLRKGNTSFTVAQISALCWEYDVSPNFLFGYSKNIFRT